MRYPTIAIITVIGVMAAETISAQKPTPPPEIPPNAIVTVANGIQLIFVPGTNPTLTARATSGENLPPGLSVAISQTVRYVDKKGQSVDPKSICLNYQIVSAGKG